MSIEIPTCPACGGRLWQTVLATDDSWVDAGAASPKTAPAAAGPADPPFRSVSVCLGCGRAGRDLLGWPTDGPHTSTRRRA